MDIKRIEHQGKVFAILIKEQKIAPGVHFITPDEAPLQIGFQNRPTGTKIKAHAHVAVKMRNTQFMQEAICIKRGRLKAIFYTESGEFIAHEEVAAGDILLLIQGGHGFEVLEEVEMFEIKMGPYDPNAKMNLEVKS